MPESCTHLDKAYDFRNRSSGHYFCIVAVFRLVYLYRWQTIDLQLNGRAEGNSYNADLS